MEYLIRILGTLAAIVGMQQLDKRKIGWPKSWDNKLEDTNGYHQQEFQKVVWGIFVILIIAIVVIIARTFA